MGEGIAVPRMAYCQGRFCCPEEGCWLLPSGGRWTYIAPPKLILLCVVNSHILRQVTLLRRTYQKYRSKLWKNIPTNTIWVPCRLGEWQRVNLSQTAISGIPDDLAGVISLTKDGCSAWCVSNFPELAGWDWGIHSRLGTWEVFSRLVNSQTRSGPVQWTLLTVQTWVQNIGLSVNPDKTGSLHSLG